MRRKPWARPELDACSFYVKNPIDLAGKWKYAFPDSSLPLEIELGCGKGHFTAQKAVECIGTNFIAIDIKSEVLAVAKRNIEQVYSSHGLLPRNILITNQNIEQIDLILNDSDVVERIYINFPNPWPKTKHYKRRLTHPRQLEHYKRFLKKGGEIIFRTDDDELFYASAEYFRSCGFQIVLESFDIYKDGLNDSCVSEHEQLFKNRGLPIHMIRAIKQ